MDISFSYSQRGGPDALTLRIVGIRPPGPALAGTSPWLRAAQASHGDLRPISSPLIFGSLSAVEANGDLRGY